MLRGDIADLLAMQVPYNSFSWYFLYPWRWGQLAYFGGGALLGLIFRKHWKSNNLYDQYAGSECALLQHQTVPHTP